MAILAFDVGGSSIKFSVMTEDGEIRKNGSVKTPSSLEEFYAALVHIKNEMEDYHLTGAAFSLPGAVDDEAGVIGGASAIPYIHDFPIKEALQKKLALSVAMENDANCAALGEAWLGAAKHCQDVVFLVIGSGVGGAVVKNKQIHHGKHLHGGEFGYMVMDNKGTILSNSGSTRALAEKVSLAKGLEKNALNGKDVFALQEAGDEIAHKAVEDMYDALARAIYNIQYCVDPELFVIGGAISERPDFAENINRHIHSILAKVEIARICPQVVRAEHGNDANLMGAVYNFLQKNK